MGTDIRIRTWIRASAAEERTGLLGYLSVFYGDLVLDGICLRRTADGRHALSFPGRPIAPVAVTATSAPLTTTRAGRLSARSRIDVNKADVTCWNKDGHSDSLERFLEDPGIRIEDCQQTHRAAPRRDHCAAPPSLLVSVGAHRFARLAALVGGA